MESGFNEDREAAWICEVTSCGLRPPSAPALHPTDELLDGLEYLVVTTVVVLVVYPDFCC